MTLTLLKRKEEKRAVLVQRPAKRAAVLSARERRLGDWREWIACLKTLVPQKAEKVSPEIVGSAFRYDVHHASR